VRHPEESQCKPEQVLSAREQDASAAAGLTSGKAARMSAMETSVFMEEDGAAVGVLAGWRSFLR